MFQILQDRVFLTPVNHDCTVHVPNTLQERVFLTPIIHDYTVHVPNMYTSGACVPNTYYPWLSCTCSKYVHFRSVCFEHLLSKTVLYMFQTLQERVFLHLLTITVLYMFQILQERVFLTLVNHTCTVHVPNTLQERVFLTPVNLPVYVPNTLQERVFLYLQHLSPISQSEEFNTLLSLRTRQGLTVAHTNHSFNFRQYR